MPYVESIATLAFSMVGSTRVDIDVAEVHDCFTGVGLIGYEDLGFGEIMTVGDGLPMYTSGVTILEGPVAHG